MKVHIIDNMCPDCLHNKYTNKKRMPPCNDNECSIVDLKKKWEKKF